MVPIPADLGLPSRFKRWRRNQPQAIEDGLTASKRFIAQVQRQGTGKTLTYMAQALLNKGRAIVLTPQKGLQDQLVDLFYEIGLRDLRGKSTYDCQYLIGHKCDDGSAAKCPYKGSTMCPHSDAKSELMEATLCSTNYPCWFASNKYATGLGEFDLMILDEAHNAPMELAKAMNIKVSEHEIYQMLKAKWPDNIEEMEAWKYWAEVRLVTATEMVKAYKAEIDQSKKAKPATIRNYRHAKNLERKLAEVASCKPAKWVPDTWSHGYQFDPLDVTEYAERYLFRGIPKVILTSGSIRPRTLQMLNIDEDDFDFFDYPSPIDVSRSPLYYIPTIKVWRHSADWEMKRLVKRIDDIVESRCDRKGIIHTWNGDVRDYIMTHSQHAKYFVTNYSSHGDNTGALVEQFRRMKPPTCFVSPSLVTGYDFPYDDCRYQIIAKLPWPNSFNSKVEQARNAADPKREAYICMQALSQMFGRGDRAEDDYQEVFILDDSVDKFLYWNKDLAPAWLPAHYRKVLTIPPAVEIN